jgi:hypothetical protein
LSEAVAERASAIRQWPHLRDHPDPTLVRRYSFVASRYEQLRLAQLAGDAGRQAKSIAPQALLPRTVRVHPVTQCRYAVTDLQFHSMKIENSRRAWREFEMRRSPLDHFMEPQLPDDPGPVHAVLYEPSTRRRDSTNYQDLWKGFRTYTPSVGQGSGIGR